MTKTHEYARIRRTAGKTQNERIVAIKFFDGPLDLNGVARFTDADGRAGPRKLRPVIDVRPEFDPLTEKLGEKPEMVIEIDRVERRWPVIKLDYEEQLTAIRAARKVRYEAELGERPGFDETVGDSIDALIKAVYGDRSELDAMAAKVQAIKKDLPKPTPPAEAEGESP